MTHDHLSRRPATAAFAPEPLDAVRARHVQEGPRRWLVEGVWIDQTPALLGAEEKSGKTLLMLDLAVSLASGTPWLGVLPIPHPGPVLAICGEDDDREALRRLDAVCRPRGLRADDLPIRLSTSLPNLSRAESLQRLADELRANPARAVLLDPLYLAIGERGDGASLYSMGAVLQDLSSLCREAGTSPLVVHHWNKGGTGTGRSRISGTGTTQWARTILSMAVTSRHEYETTVQLAGRDVCQVRTSTSLKIEVTGNSVPSSTHSFQRLMWAEDPSDLDSPLHYDILPGQRVAAAQQVMQALKAPATRDRVLRAAQRLTWFSRDDLLAWEAKNPPETAGDVDPMKSDTVYRVLRQLADEGVLRHRPQAGSRGLIFTLAEHDTRPDTQPR